MKKCNILFTSVGRRVALIKLFHSALKSAKVSGQIITADMSRLSAASFISDHHELVPAVQSPEYIESLLAICKKFSIKLLVPLIDTELVKLSEHRDAFEKIGTCVLVSSVETNKTCFDKRLTSNFFNRIGVITPRLLDPTNVLKDSTPTYPYFIKPFSGSSSAGATKIHTSQELAFFKDYIKNGILQEYIEGDEYTLDVLLDFEGNVKTVVPRLRIETRAGEISKGVTVRQQQIIEAGQYVARSLPGAMGCITIQCFLTPQNEVVFIEINPRFGGGFPLSAQAGANFPRWLIETVSGTLSPISVDQWQEGVVMLRYDDAVFVDKKAILS